MITSQLVWEQVWGLVLELIRHQPSDLTQGMCLQQSLAVWCCRKTQACFELSAVGAGSPAAAKRLQKGQGSLASQVALEQRSCCYTYLPQLVKVTSELSLLPGLAVVSITKLILGHLSWIHCWDCDQPAMCFDASHCKKKQKTSSSACCCSLRELFLLFCKVRNTSGYAAKPMCLSDYWQRAAANEQDGLWVKKVVVCKLVHLSPTPVACKFSVTLCNSYFIPSDLCQKHFGLWLNALQSLRSQNE